MDRATTRERARKAASRSAKIGVGVVGARAEMDRRRRTSQVGDSVGGAITKALALSLLVASAVSIVWKLLSLRRPQEHPSKA